MSNGNPFSKPKSPHDSPVRILLYGEGGVGKSTFGAHAPNPAFISTEQGLVALDVHASHPETWPKLKDHIHWLATAKHDYQSVVVDSLDWAEPMCWQYVCENGKVKHIEDFGYGKGYVVAGAEWRLFLHELEQCWRRGLHVILIGHAVRKNVRNPEGDDYEAFQCKLQERAIGLCKEWVDIMAFAQYETVVREVSKGRFKGEGTGRRVLRCHKRPAYDAKVRLDVDFPAALPLDWHTFHSYIKGAPERKLALRNELAEKLTRLGDKAVADGATAYIEERGQSMRAHQEALATVDEYLKEAETEKAERENNQKELS